MKKKSFLLIFKKMSYYGREEMTEEERKRILDAMTLTNPLRDRPDEKFVTDRNEFTYWDDMQAGNLREDNWDNGMWT